MKVAIAGARGLVGKELTRQFAKEHQVSQLTHRDLDVTDAEAVKRVLFAERPTLIINCAVLGVDACEIEPALAWSVNVAGAKNLASAANALDAGFLQLSTNYVFDGKLPADSVYTVKDVPCPISVYGQTKLAAEHEVSAASRRCFIVRTSWVFGVGKESFFSTAHRSLNRFKKIQAITDVRASTTYVRDLGSRIIEIVSRRHYATYHVVNGGSCSYYDFAMEAGAVLKLPDSELRHLIEPVNVSALRQNAQRPPHSPMRCLVSEDLGLAPLPDWRVALREYIRDDRSNM
ncbi:MAG: dTDP-4-dehydrorhamnose reductase [Pyrinomonadaceae bacterium]